MPTVTIVLPTLHHRHPQLQEALASIAAQTFQDFVVFVMPDGPDPELAEVLRGDALWDRIAIIPLGRPWHIYGAPQRLIAGYLARTEFMAYLDDDNLWLPRHLELLLTAVDGHDFAFAAQERPDGVVFDGEPCIGKIDTSALLHRTEAIRLAQWPIDHIHVADGLFAERLVAAGATYAFVPEVTNIYTGAHIGDGQTAVHL
jgi:glycosyltransferase involved in cell wall biosynthesis